MQIVLFFYTTLHCQIAITLQQILSYHNKPTILFFTSQLVDIIYNYQYTKFRPQLLTLTKFNLTSSNPFQGVKFCWWCADLKSTLSQYILVKWRTLSNFEFWSRVWQVYATGVTFSIVVRSIEIRLYIWYNIFIQGPIQLDQKFWVLVTAIVYVRNNTIGSILSHCTP